jgi:eukaryotic-like serine/threonine-protein kinase
MKKKEKSDRNHKMDETVDSPVRDENDQKKISVFMKLKQFNWRRFTDWHLYADRIKKIRWNACREKLGNGLDELQTNGKSFLFVVICALFLMCFACVAVFFVTVKGQEEVMVPNVTGKELTVALLEMQVKELYPKIQLRYSNVPGDAGKILEQTPEAGAIVKAGRRMTLVVSRGVIIDHVENYVGMSFDDVKIKLQMLFAGSITPLIVLEEPVYKADSAAAGTVLAQTPPDGTHITTPVRVSLIVSRGPETEKTRIPNLVGKSVDEVLSLMARTRVIFDFTQHPAADGEKKGTVVRQQLFDTDLVSNYTRVTADFAMPASDQDGNVYGLFTDTLTVYPYPVEIKLEADPQDGELYTIVTFKHPGGRLTIPYDVPRGTSLILSAAGKVRRRVTIQ